jgi:aminoglycoside 6-adenylyltransferase
MSFVAHSPDDVILKLVLWAQQQDAVRAMLMTSTRAVPNASVDDLSDYDIVLFVDDIHPFHEDQKWLEYFGEVLVVYQDPIYPDQDFGIEKFGNVTQYLDGLKIDFTVCHVSLLQRIAQAPALPAELDAGYRILLDKDRLTDQLMQPAHRAYVPVRPTEELYQRTVNDFFSDPPYVAKCLLRGELLPMKWCLDYDMKHVYLRQMLEWKIGLDTGWSVPVGSLGKGLKKNLSPQIWSQVEEAYADATVADNWRALFRTMDVFRLVAMEVGKGLGYRYPLELDQRVTDFVKDWHRRSLPQQP